MKKEGRLVETIKVDGKNTVRFNKKAVSKLFGDLSTHYDIEFNLFVLRKVGQEAKETIQYGKTPAFARKQAKQWFFEEINHNGALPEKEAKCYNIASKSYLQALIKDVKESK